MSVSKRHRVMALVCCAAASALAASATNLQASSGGSVTIVRNGTITEEPGLGFRFQDLREPVLAALATRERLRERIDPRATEFEQIVQLRKWVASQWRPGSPDPYPPWNALTVLDWIRARKTGGHCGQYSQVFLQSLAALGFTARYVELGYPTNPYAHYVVEVWSNDFNKWVVMDADFNLYYERKGIPLGALEMHDAFVDGSSRDVTAHWSHQLKRHSSPFGWKYRTAEFFYYVRFHLKADHLTKPDEPPFDRFNDMVEWADPRVPPWESSTVVSEFPKERLTKVRTSDRAQVLPMLNQVKVGSRLLEDGRVEVTLQHNVRQFLRYEYRILRGRSAGAWIAHQEPSLTLPALPGAWKVEIRAVNVRGVGGPAAQVAVQSQH
jgi:hypothetical protein